MSDNVIVQILEELKSIRQEQNNMNTSSNKQFDELKKEIKVISNKIDGVSEQVAKNAVDVTDIKDNQKTIANVINQMASVQERQEKTIDLLARRSLDQEAELKRIK